MENMGKLRGCNYLVERSFFFNHLVPEEQIVNCVYSGAYAAFSAGGGGCTLSCSGPHVSSP